MKIRCDYKDSAFAWNYYLISIETRDKEVFDKFNDLMVDFESWFENYRRKKND